MNLNVLYPRSDAEIKTAKNKTLLFLVLPSVMFFTAGVLSFIGAGSAEGIEMLGGTLPSATGAVLIVMAGIMLAPAYFALSCLEEISYDTFKAEKREIGQPRAVNDYIREMKRLNRTKLVKEDTVRLKKLAKWQRNGKETSHRKSSSILARR
jgi:hypothetical protein